MTKICPTPDWYYHDESLEYDDDECHHNNLYEDCDQCAIEEGEMDLEDVDWVFSLQARVYIQWPW